jgi:hypothetical protein
MSDSPDLPRLGSLAQSARSKHLKQARGTLIAIGILTIVANAAGIALAKSQISEALDKRVQELRAQGRVVDPKERQDVEDRIVRTAYLIGGGTVFLGVLFVVFGLIIYKFPVPVTALSLILYVGVNAVFALLNPDWAKVNALAWVIRIIIVVGLVKALQAAIAYQKEQNRAAAMESGI